MGKVMENLINGHEAIGYGTHKRSQARATVAELRINIDRKVVPRLPDHKGGPHVIIVHARKVLSLTEFKQMFYARGDDHFCLAERNLLINGDGTSHERLFLQLLRCNQHFPFLL